MVVLTIGAAHVGVCEVEILRAMLFVGFDPTATVRLRLNFGESGFRVFFFSSCLVAEKGREFFFWLSEVAHYLLFVYREYERLSSINDSS